MEIYEGLAIWDLGQIVYPQNILVVQKLCDFYVEFWVGLDKKDQAGMTKELTT